MGLIIGFTLFLLAVLFVGLFIGAIIFASRGGRINTPGRRSTGPRYKPTAPAQNCSCSSGKVDCPSCHGKGWHRGYYEDNPTQTCVTCGGSGRLTCTRCDGSGKLLQGW